MLLSHHLAYESCPSSLGSFCRKTKVCVAFWGFVSYLEFVFTHPHQCTYHRSCARWPLWNGKNMLECQYFNLIKKFLPFVYLLWSHIRQQSIESVNKSASHGHVSPEISSDRCAQPEKLRPLLYTLGIGFYVVIKSCRQVCGIRRFW